jgi:uncharacterized membrane protein
MKNERLQRWISIVRGTPAEAAAETPVEEVGADSPSSLQRIQDKVMTTRALGIIALVVFAPVVMIVILKVLRDIRSSLG